MKAHPMLFSGPMVRALLREAEAPGTGKTQTRRVLKPQPRISRNATPFYRPHPSTSPREWHCLLDSYIHNIQVIPYAPGDLIWVREAWRSWMGWDHRPRRLSRLTLAITDVRVERVQDISERDAAAEGIVPKWPDGVPIEHDFTGCICIEGYHKLWDDLNAKRGFGWDDVNPWVAAITFTVHRQNIDAYLKERTS